MKMIQEYTEQIKLALYDAKEYAEKYLYYKSINNDKYSQCYFEMANDEIKHAKYLHEIVNDEYGKMADVYNPPELIKEKMDATNEYFKLQSNHIKLMLI